MSPLEATLRTELAPLGYAVDTSLKCTADRLARIKAADARAVPAGRPMWSSG